VVNSHLIKFLLGKQSFYKVLSSDSYDRLKFHIFAWLGVNPDYAPAIRTYKSFLRKKYGPNLPSYVSTEEDGSRTSLNNA
jgi:hypothetical protein